AVFDNRQSETETAMSAREALVRLPEPIEHIRQELGGNPYAAIDDCDFNRRVHVTQLDFDTSALRREFHGVRQQVPEHLQQALAIAVNRTQVVTRVDDDRQRLRVGGGPDAFEGAVNQL